MTEPNWLLIIALIGTIAVIVVGGTWAVGKWGGHAPKPPEDAP